MQQSETGYNLFSCENESEIFLKRIFRVFKEWLSGLNFNLLAPKAKSGSLEIDWALLNPFDDAGVSYTSWKIKKEKSNWYFGGHDALILRISFSAEQHHLKLDLSTQENIKPRFVRVIASNTNCKR